MTRAALAIISMCSMTIVTFALLLSSANAYFPNSLNFCYARKTPCPDTTLVDHTHSSMTKLSVTRVTEKLALSAGISLDGWQTSRQDALHQILDGSGEVGRLRDKESAYHFNAERFQQAEDLLISWRRQILKLTKQPCFPGNLKAVRHLIGQSLHLIQDFYSNTDWVIYWSESYDQLGVENKSDPLVFGVKEFPCRKKGAKLAKNIDWITSGYRLDQDIPPTRNGNDSKCIHGGRYDNSDTAGGINTESSDESLSPAYCWLHSLSSTLAVNASETFLMSRLGLSSVIQKEDLLTILGVGTPAHVSLMLTSTLRRLSKHSHWMDTWRLVAEKWPWKVNHLFSARGTKVMGNTVLYQELSTQRHASLHKVTPEKVLRAVSVLPDYSHLVVVTNMERDSLPSDIQVQLIENLLKERNIKLLWFMEKTTPLATGETIAGIQRACTATGGIMIFFSDIVGLLQPLAAMRPHTAQIEFAMQETVNILVPAKTPSYLLTNCLERQTSWPQLTTDSRLMPEREFNSTGYLSITKLTPLTTELTTVSVRPQRSCTVSLWTSERSLVDVYTVTKGPRDQWYPTPINAGSEGRVVIETSPTYANSLSLKGVESSDYDITFRSCPYNASRSELSPTQLTDTVSDIQGSRLTISLAFNHTNISIQTYIDTRKVEINAMSLLPDNTTSINISVVNNKADEMDMQFYILEDSDIDISPPNFSSSVNNTNCFVTINLEPGYLSTSQRRCLTFVVEGFYHQTQTQTHFTNVHTFQVLLDGPMYNLPQRGDSNYQRCIPITTSTTTTSTTTTSTSTTSTKVTSPIISRAATDVASHNLDVNITSVDEPKIDIVQIFILSAVAAILTTTTPILIGAAAIYLHFHRKRGKRLQVTEL